MAAPSYTYTLTNGNTADASQVTQNFNDILNGVTDGTKDITVNLLTTNGSVILGDNSADTVTYNARVASHLAPSAQFTYDLGTSTLGWRSLYLGDAGSAARGTRLLGATVSADWTMTLPTGGGVAGQLLQTNGSGTTSWAWATGSHSSVSADHTVTDTDGVALFLMTTGSTNRTATLPTLADNVGRIIGFRKVDSGSGSYTIDGESAETIEGLASVQIAFQHEEIWLRATAAGWVYLGQHYQSFNVTAPTISGGGTSPSGFARGVRVGRQVTLFASVTTGGAGSPGTTVTFTTPVPAAFRATAQVLTRGTTDETTDSVYDIKVQTSGDLEFRRIGHVNAADQVQLTSWGNSVTQQFAISYVV